MEVLRLFRAVTENRAENFMRGTGDGTGNWGFRSVH